MGNESKKMRRSAQTTENIENEAEGELKAKKNQTNDKVTTIATLDNGTMIEAFKYLNYCGLAKNSLVSKRFCCLIQTHRHTLALLYVDFIGMFSIRTAPGTVQIFDNQLSPKTYIEWIIFNYFSKQRPVQVASTQSTQTSDGYLLSAFAHYKDPNHRERNDRTHVFTAEVELNMIWPAFQHFIRLVTDPFIYIDRVHLIYQNDVLNLLAGAIDSDYGRLQCKELNVDLNANSRKTLSWAKNYVRCNQVSIYGETDLNRDKALLGFFVTAALCTPSIKIGNYDFLKVTVDFVQKFMDLENWDEYHGVQSIEGFRFVKNQDIQVLKKYYSKFIAKEERGENHHSTEHVFEFTNNAIGKKLQLTITIFDDEHAHWCSGARTFSVKINNL